MKPILVLPVDPEVEADAYRLGSTTLSPGRIGAALEGASHFGNEEAAGEWLVRPLFYEVFRSFGVRTTYPAPDLSSIILRHNTPRLKRVLRDARNHFDYLSVHYWDVVTHSRRAILTHYSESFSDARFTELYSQVNRWYEALGNAGPTLVQMIEERCLGTVSFLIVKDEDVRLRLDGVPLIPFPTEAVAALAAALPFDPGDHTSSAQLELELDASLASLRPSDLARIISFGTRLERVLRVRVSTRDAAHIAIGILGWERTVGLLPYLFVGSKYQTLFGISLSAPLLRLTGEGAPTTLPPRLAGLVRGLGAALMTAQQEITEYFRSRAAFGVYLRHDADKTIHLITSTTAHAAELVPTDLGDDLRICSKEARYLFELTKLFTRVPFDPKLVARTEGGDCEDIGIILSAIAARDLRFGRNLASVTDIILPDGTVVGFGRFAESQVTTTLRACMQLAPLRLMLENLLKNAREHLLGDSRIQVQLGNTRTFGTIEIAVSDSGTPYRYPRESGRGHRIIAEVISALRRNGESASFTLPELGASGLHKKVFRLRIPGEVR